MGSMTVVIMAIVLTLASCQSERAGGQGDAGRRNGAAESAAGPALWSAPTRGGEYHVTFSTDPAVIPLNQPFRMDVTLVPERVRAGTQVDPQRSVDVRGWMPSHGHGMYRAPVVEARGEGRFEVSGMLFHMSGAWEIAVDVRDRFGVSSAVFPIEVP